MTFYILRRLIQTLIVLAVLSFITYGMMGLMPGDPLDIMCSANPRCTPENIDQMKKIMGLDRPIHERYWKWISSFVQGDFGYSRTYRLPVKDIMLPRLANTMILGLLSIALSLLIAIPLGVFSSLRHRKPADYIINFFAFVGISAPSFWLGLILIIIFAVHLKWFPASGVQTVDGNVSGIFADIMDRLKYLVLPTLTLSLLEIASWARYTRSSMLETLRMDFIRTAKAKGLSSEEVIVRHALGNALLPVVTVVAMNFSIVFSGAIITETVFAYQGVGLLMYNSIMGNDFNVAMCCFIMICSVVLFMNLVADLLYAYLDPRISYS